MRLDSNFFKFIFYFFYFLFLVVYFSFKDGSIREFDGNYSLLSPFICQSVATKEEKRMRKGPTQLNHSGSQINIQIIPIIFIIISFFFDFSLFFYR